MTICGKVTRIIFSEQNLFDITFIPVKCYISLAALHMH